MRSKLKLTPADTFLQKAPISFDASVQVSTMYFTPCQHAISVVYTCPQPNCHLCGTAWPRSADEAGLRMRRSYSTPLHAAAVWFWQALAWRRTHRHWHASCLSRRSQTAPVCLHSWRFCSWCGCIPLRLNALSIHALTNNAKGIRGTIQRGGPGLTIGSGCCC